MDIQLLTKKQLSQRKWYNNHPEYQKKNGENNKKKFHEGSEEYKEHVRKLGRERFKRYYEKKKVEKIVKEKLL